MWPFYRKSPEERIRSLVGDYIRSLIKKDEVSYRRFVLSLQKSSLETGDINTVLSYLHNAEELRNKHSSGLSELEAFSPEMSLEKLLLRLQQKEGISKEEVQELLENRAFRKLYPTISSIGQVRKEFPHYSLLKGIRKTVPLVTSSLLTMFATGEIELNQIAESFSGEGNWLKPAILVGLAVLGFGGNYIRFNRDRELQQQYSPIKTENKESA